jgi:hypothetical protein
MKPGMIEAGRALAAVLERENAALTAMDLPGAAALYPVKDAAAAALKAAQSDAGDGMAATLDAEQRRLARELAERLRDLIEENRRLLQRAIHVQGQVLGTIARAVAMSTPRAQPPRYGATGAFAHIRRQAPVVLSARA